MTRHGKTIRPSDLDLHRNPLIGGSKGVTMAQASSDDLEQIEGENTFEGDLENDTNPQGGIDRGDQRRGRPAHRDHTQKPRKVERHGRKTHEQQIRMLERKPDLPDTRQIEEGMSDIPLATSRLPRHSEARQSEFAVSRGGLNQESHHNKHNDPGQRGHKPPRRG
ncbi:hypothetical protein [Bradyrhizobium sp.]|uniref:hypothetical protein n=1 Tax=Bradyrhizobium sp. TaxID=376 RepID=UPI004037C46C